MRTSGLTGAPEMTAEELALLESELISTKAPGGVIEIGTAAGGTFVRVYKALPRDRRVRLSVVDVFTYYPDHLGVFKRTLRDNGVPEDAVDIRAARSNLALAEAVRRKESFSFIIVDASHKLKHVTQDLSWLSLLAVGGKAAFHDYGEKIPAVRIAVDKFLRRNRNYRMKARAGTLAVLEKTAPTKGGEVSYADHAFAIAYTIVQQNKKTINRLSSILRLPSR
jgi:hypothetical protein